MYPRTEHGGPRIEAGGLPIEFKSTGYFCNHAINTARLVDDEIYESNAS